MKTFRGGIHPPEAKLSSIINPIKRAAVPPFVILPLQQHIGAPAIPLVNIGDRVTRGMKIAEAQGFISSAIHASVNGTVKAIDVFPHPLLGRAQAIHIESDKPQEEVTPARKDTALESFSAQEIVTCVKEAGVVGLGGAAFPTHVKLSPPAGKPIDTVIINGAECEPFLTCDHLLMMTRAVDSIKGAELIMKAVGAKKCYIGIEDNKMDALELLLSKVRGLHLSHVIPVPLKVKYPQGAEKQLIKVLLNREVPSGALPLDVGVVVHNVATAVAIYEAVYCKKPLYERVVTVAGSCTRASQNILVRIGTPIKNLLDEVGGLINPPVKVIMGGPMTGIAQDTLEVPVIKGTSGLITMYAGEHHIARTRSCIRCGRCVEICPMGLMPNAITLAGEYGRFEEAEERGVYDCVECGACAYICPAKRSMVQSIKVIKNELFRRKRVEKKT